MNKAVLDRDIVIELIDLPGALDGPSVVEEAGGAPSNGYGRVSGAIPFIEKLPITPAIRSSEFVDGAHMRRGRGDINPLVAIHGRAIDRPTDRRLIHVAIVILEDVVTGKVVQRVGLARKNTYIRSLGGGVFHDEGAAAPWRQGVHPITWGEQALHLVTEVE